MAENIPPVFNGQLNLRAAYDWNQAQVYTFLNNVANNPHQYGVPQANAQELISINNHLQALSLPNGADFIAGTALEPDQHIYRRRNPNWISETRDRSRRGGRLPLEPLQSVVSKFIVRKHIHNGREYWSPYDLLGLFLSSMGPAPNTATKRSFFLPLTAVYGRWCRVIAGPQIWGGPDSVDVPPFMFQCTWRIETGQPTEFFLGSSLAGYDWRYQLTGSWESELRRTRFDLLDSDLLATNNWDFDTSPRMETKFGNCAETYPFLQLLVGHNPATQTCYGIALQRNYLATDGYQDRRSGVVWRHVRNPCDNCKELIRLYGGDVENFRRYNGSNGAPP